MYEWDEKKNQSNILKHGISFDEAKDIFKDPGLLTFVDNRFDYGEIRYVSIGKLDLPTQPLLIALVVYTNRKSKTRIISARKANKKERNLYEQHNTV